MRKYLQNCRCSDSQCISVYTTIADIVMAAYAVIECDHQKNIRERYVQEQNECKYEEKRQRNNNKHSWNGCQVILINFIMVFDMSI